MLDAAAKPAWIHNFQYSMTMATPKRISDHLERNELDAVHEEGKGPPGWERAPLSPTILYYYQLSYLNCPYRSLRQN